VEFGIYLNLENPTEWEVPLAEVCRESLYQAELAEDLGYDSVWVTEGHFDPDWFPSTFVLCGAIAARTTTIRLGQSVTILPLFHPVQVAENAAVVDVLSGGRFSLGVGVGFANEEFETFQIPRLERGPRMEEGLEILRGCLTHATFGYSGKYYQFDPIGVWPRPVQQPHPPIWAAAMIPKTARRAARHGCHLDGSGEPELIRIYDETLVANGYDPKDFGRATFRLVHIAASKEQAWTECAAHVRHKMAGYAAKYSQLSDYKTGIFKGKEGGAYGLDTIPSTTELIELALDGKVNFFGAPFLIGTVDDVIRGMQEAEQDGVTLMRLWMQFGGLDPRKTRDTMRTFCRDILPLFK
jgi:alkanesulfonate monooxygenase SsuD/methylene tetrahydromethanopterin reductase-like flavin-dependent oxidoreductase (luciferase family)